MGWLMIGETAEELKWRPIRGIDKGRLRDARLQAHYAAQWLARVARGYIPPQPDDGHTSLNWDLAIDGFKTQPLKDGTWLSLQISNLTLALNGGAGPDGAQSLFLSGRTDPEVHEWLGRRLGKIVVDTRPLDTPSPYEHPAHAIAKGASYDVVASTNALAELAIWFSNANFLLGQIQRQLIGRQLAASPVCYKK